MRSPEAVASDWEKGTDQVWESGESGTAVLEPGAPAQGDPWAPDQDGSDEEPTTDGGDRPGSDHPVMGVDDDLDQDESYFREEDADDDDDDDEYDEDYDEFDDDDDEPLDDDADMDDDDDL